jgi:hypothetical protein
LWHKWGERPAGNDETCNAYCESIGETCLDHNDVNDDGTSTFGACPPMGDTQWWYNNDPSSTPQDPDHYDHMGINGIPDCDKLDYVGNSQWNEGATVNCTTIYDPPDQNPDTHPPSAHGYRLCGDGYGVCKDWQGHYSASCSKWCIIKDGPNAGTEQRAFFYWVWPGAYPGECSCYNDASSGGNLHTSPGWDTIKNHHHGAIKHQTSYPKMGGEDWSDFDEIPHDEGNYWGSWMYGGPWYNIYERLSCNHENRLYYSNYGDTAENFCCCTNTQEHETYDHST